MVGDTRSHVCEIGCAKFTQGSRGSQGPQTGTPYESDCMHEVEVGKFNMARRDGNALMVDSHRVINSEIESGRPQCVPRAEKFVALRSHQMSQECHVSETVSTVFRFIAMVWEIGINVA